MNSFVLNYNQLLGVAVPLAIGNCKYTICALLYNDAEFIQESVIDVPIPCE